MGDLGQSRAVSDLDRLLGFAQDDRPHSPGLRPAPGPSAAVPHGTTIVALRYAEGAVLAGDRRATSGNLIAQRDLEKVLVVDEYSAAGFAGSVGHALQMLKLFAAEVEQFEKVEGTRISVPGKVQRLSRLVLENLAAARQGFVAVPLFVAYEPEPGGGGDAATIVSFDPVGNAVTDRTGYESIGSGSPFAKASLKKRHDVGCDRPTALYNALAALYDAADDDTATAGPDRVRGINPIAVTVTADGAVRCGSDEIDAVVERLVADRECAPGG